MTKRKLFDATSMPENDSRFQEALGDALIFSGSAVFTILLTKVVSVIGDFNTAIGN